MPRSGRLRLFALSSDWRDWLFVPLGIQLTIVFFVMYPAYPVFLVEMGRFQVHASEVFPFTWTSALVLFAFSIWAFYWRLRLDAARAVVYGLGLCLLATSLFEILYQNVGSGVGVGNQGLESQLINVSSILFGFSSVKYWGFPRYSLVAVIAYLSGWLVWVAAGYPQIFSPDPHVAQAAFLYNAVLKVGSFALVGLFLASGLFARGSRRTSAPVGEGSPSAPPPTPV